MRLWETYATSADGEVLFIAQVFLPPDVDAAVAHDIATSLTVSLAKVP
jgi:hypothetical protein